MAARNGSFQVIDSHIIITQRYNAEFAIADIPCIAVASLQIQDWDIIMIEYIINGPLPISLITITYASTLHHCKYIITSFFITSLYTHHCVQFIRASFHYCILLYVILYIMTEYIPKYHCTFTHTLSYIPCTSSSSSNLHHLSAQESLISYIILHYYRVYINIQNTSSKCIDHNTVLYASL